MGSEILKMLSKNCIFDKKNSVTGSIYYIYFSPSHVELLSNGTFAKWDRFSNVPNNDFLFLYF